MTIVKRSVAIAGHSTSISIEDRFWERLRTIAAERGLSTARLVAGIDAERDPASNLSSAIRIFVLEDALARAARGAD
ncbi:ribbon-helix-helix domain-containing protein [Jiella sp. M17.18]|uniref:ribbon-helix-helix domain-containing protein n=1 Tax=Jiella sp. M17.18 TaxID=3234247 RepID=UPI0034DE5BE2